MLLLLDFVASSAVRNLHNRHIEARSTKYEDKSARPTMKLNRRAAVSSSNNDSVDVSWKSSASSWTTSFACRTGLAIWLECDHRSGPGMEMCDFDHRALPFGFRGRYRCQRLRCCDGANIAIYFIAGLCPWPATSSRFGGTEHSQCKFAARPRRRFRLRICGKVALRLVFVRRCRGVSYAAVRLDHSRATLLVHHTRLQFM